MGDQSYQERIVTEILGTTDRKFKSYFEVYEDLIAYSDEFVFEPSLRLPDDTKHTAVLAAARVLRADPTLTRDKACDSLEQELIPRRFLRQQLDRFILISVRLMFMLECEGSWESDEPFVDYMSTCFPKYPSVPSNVQEALENKRSLKAWKLKRKCHLSFKRTNSIADHLILDLSHPDDPTLLIFHHTSFLNAQLDRQKQRGYNTEEDLLYYLKIGCLPPHLVAETLHSIQDILFQCDDDKSQDILQRLCYRRGFDRDCLIPEGYKLFEDPSHLKYVYWGKRLVALHDFVLDPPPHNKFERWIKWQTSESNAFAIALFALLISIVVGFLSLGLASVQTWIAYKAWKETVNGAAG